MLSWGFLILISRVLVAGHGFNPWVLSFVQMAVGGAAMMVAAGRGPMPLRAFRHPQTWIYGVLRVVTAATLTARGRQARGGSYRPAGRWAPRPAKRLPFA